MNYRFKWSVDDPGSDSECESLSDLIGIVGLFYIALIAIAFIFVFLSRDGSFAQILPSAVAMGTCL